MGILAVISGISGSGQTVMASNLFEEIGKDIDKAGDDFDEGGNDGRRAGVNDAQNGNDFDPDCPDGHNLAYCGGWTAAYVDGYRSAGVVSSTTNNP